MNKILRLCFASLVAIALTTPLLACKPPQEPATMVSVSAPARVNAGQSFSVNILVTPGQAIAGVQCDLNFEGSLFNVTAVTEGALLKQSGATTYFSPGNTGGGSISGIAGAIMTTGKTVSTPGIFAGITFNAGMVEGAGMFTVSNVVIGDINGSPVAFSVSGAQVVITHQTG